MSNRHVRPKATRLHLPTAKVEHNVSQDMDGEIPNKAKTAGASLETDKHKDKSESNDIVSNSTLKQKQTIAKYPAKNIYQNFERNIKKPKGLPKGFVTRDEMQKRINERKHQTQSSRNFKTFPKKTESSSLLLNTDMYTLESEEKNQASAKTIPVGRIINTNASAPSYKQVKTRFTNKCRVQTTTDIEKNHYRKDASASDSATLRLPSKPIDFVDKQKNTKPMLSLRSSQDKTPLTNEMLVQPEIKRVTRASVQTAHPVTSKHSNQDDHTKKLLLTDLRLITMNANGQNDAVGNCPERRRRAIANIVSKHKPHIVLFQEFKWKRVSGKTWGNITIPDEYSYLHHDEASIMYDANYITVAVIPRSEIEPILNALQRSALNRLRVTFPMDFVPLSRMSIVKVEANVVSNLKFICVSWHGQYNKLNKQKRIEYFRYLMEFLRNIREKFSLPLLIGGDFNIAIDSIKHCVLSPFKLCEYKVSTRRKKNGAIDFFVVTEDLMLSDVTWIDLEKDTDAKEPNAVLDHDPVIATLSCNSNKLGEVISLSSSFGKDRLLIAKRA